MAECVETRCEEDLTRVMDLENQDQKVPSSDEYCPDFPGDINDGEVPVNCPIKPMSDVYVQSLEAAKPMLQKKVLVGNILQKLHESKSGFLDDVARDKVENGGSNRMRMHILIEILKTKDNAALTTFCKVLEDSHYVEAAEKLTREIALKGHSKCLEDCPSEIELDKISEIVGGDYQRLLTHLGIPAATIKSFRLNNIGNVHSTCFEGLVFWREGNEPCRPATWSVLLDALEKGAGLKKYADCRRSELLSLKPSCQTESLEKTQKVLKEKNVALSLSPLEAAVKKLDPILAEVLSEFRHHVTQLLPKSPIYSKVRSKCQTMIARKAGVSSFNKFDVPLKVSKFAENIIKKHTTFFDIELIHEVANLLQQPTLKEAVARYEAELEPLMRTSITELTDRCEVRPINQDSPEGTYQLVLKFPDDANVKDLYKAKDYLEKVLRIPDAKLLAFDFGCILAYFKITCTDDTLKDLPKKFTKHSDQLKAMGISGAFLIDHWAWGADSDDVWYANDESDDMEVNDRQRFLGKRKRSHLGSVSGGYSEIVPSKKTSHFKENCSAEKECGDKQRTAEENCGSQPPHSPCTEKRRQKIMAQHKRIGAKKLRALNLERAWEDLRSRPERTLEELIAEKERMLRELDDRIAEHKREQGALQRVEDAIVRYKRTLEELIAEKERMLWELDNRIAEHKSVQGALRRVEDAIVWYKRELEALQRAEDAIVWYKTPLWNSWTVEQLRYKTPSDSGLKEVASEVWFAEDQRILAKKLGVTLSRQQPNPLFNALKTWRDGGGGKDHPPTWRCLLDALLQIPRVDPHVVSVLMEKATYLTEFSSAPVRNKTPSDSGLKEVASQVQSAWQQRILAEKLGVTLSRQHRNPLFDALKRWRDGGGGKDHPPTWRCLLDALSQTPGVDPHVVRDLEEKATCLREFSLDGECREISSSDYHHQTNLRSSKLLKLSSSGKSSTQPVLRRLARKRRNRLKAISSSTQLLNCHRRKSQRTIRTSRTSHTHSLPFFAQPQTVHADSTDEVESTGMDQTDSGFSNDQ